MVVNKLDVEGVGDDIRQDKKAMYTSRRVTELVARAEDQTKIQKLNIVPVSQRLRPVPTLAVL